MVADSRRTATTTASPTIVSRRAPAAPRRKSVKCCPAGRCVAAAVDDHQPPRRADHLPAVAEENARGVVVGRRAGRLRGAHRFRRERRQPVARHQLVARVDHDADRRVLGRGDDLEEAGGMLADGASRIAGHAEGAPRHDILTDRQMVWPCRRRSRAHRPARTVPFPPDDGATGSFRGIRRPRPAWPVRRWNRDRARARVRQRAEAGSEEAADMAARRRRLPGVLPCTVTLSDRAASISRCGATAVSTA